MTPVWLLDLVAAVMLTVAAVSAARLAAARPWRPGAVVIDTDVAHLLMAIAMAGMLTSRLTTLPDAAWEVIFGLMTVWFAVRVLTDARASGVRSLAGGHCAPHLVHSAAMLYMFLALSAPTAGMSGMSGLGAPSGGSGAMMTLRLPTLAFVFTLILAGYSIWDLDQLSSRRYARAAGSRPLAAIAAPAAAGPTAWAASGPAVRPEAGPAAGVAAGPWPAVLPDPGDGNVVGGATPESAAVDGRALSGTAGPGVTGFLLSPAVTVGCRITMGVAMVFMLIIAS
jgi:hypothetical protein